MSQFFLYLGLVFVAIGILIIILFAVGKSGEGKAEVGVGGFIGFIPFGFATSKSTLYVAISLSIVCLAIFLVLSR